MAVVLLYCHSAALLALGGGGKLGSADGDIWRWADKVQV